MSTSIETIKNHILAVGYYKVGYYGVQDDKVNPIVSLSSIIAETVSKLIGVACVADWHPEVHTRLIIGTEEYLDEF
jgi:hypothetical protein